MTFFHRTVGEVHLNMGISGQGPTAVLVHGSWDDHSAWDAVAAILSRSCRVVTYDRRGHGASSVPDGQGRISQDVADLDGVIAACSDGPVHLVGHSYGACVALMYAAQHPHRLSSLTLHEPPLFGVLSQAPQHGALLRASRDAMARAAALIEAGECAQGARVFAEEVALVDQTWEDAMDARMRATWVANAATWLDQSRDPERLALSPELLVDSVLPVLLTNGTASPPAFEPGVARLAAATPCATRRTLAGAGHFPQLTHPDAFADVLCEFFRSTTPICPAP